MASENGNFRKEKMMMMMMMVMVMMMMMMIIIHINHWICSIPCFQTSLCSFKTCDSEGKPGKLRGVD